MRGGHQHAGLRGRSLELPTALGGSRGTTRAAFATALRPEKRDEWP